MTSGSVTITLVVALAVVGFTVAHRLHGAGHRRAAFTADALVVAIAGAVYLYAHARYGVH